MLWRFNLYRRCGIGTLLKMTLEAAITGRLVNPSGLSTYPLEPASGNA
jgi:hypothetical protein